MQTDHGLSARRADRVLHLSRSARHYRPRVRDYRPLIAAIEVHLKGNPGHGFGWLFELALRPVGWGKTGLLVAGISRRAPIPPIGVPGSLPVFKSLIASSTVRPAKPSPRMSSGSGQSGVVCRTLSAVAFAATFAS